MPDTTVVKNIKIVKNNTRPIEDTFFPNIDYREQVLEYMAHKKRHTMIQSRIPIIRGDVYLVQLVHRYEDDETTPSRKKEYISRFLQEANIIQQKYIVQEKHLPIGQFGEPLIYKMEY